MSLTLSSAYKYAAKSSSFTVDWIVQLYYGAEGANDWIGLSGNDRTVGSVRYYGVVSDWGEITQSIDLGQSKATVGSWTIRCANTWKTTTLAEELFYGTNKYLNHKAVVYAVPNDDTTLANCLKMEWFRLKGIQSTESEVVLNFEHWTPFDYITIPSTKSTNQKVYEPIIYGDYTPDETGPNIGQDFPTAAVVHPVPVVDVKADRIYAAHHEAVAAAGALYVYEKNCREFVVAEIDASPYKDDASESYDGLNCTTSQSDLNHGWHQRPLSANYDSTLNGTPLNGFDTDTGTYAFFQQLSITKSGSGAWGDDDYEYYRLDIPIISHGKVKTFKVHYKYNIEIDGETDPGAGNITNHRMTFELLDNTFGNNVEIKQLQDTLQTISGGVYDYETSDDNSGAYVTIDHSAALATANYVLPEYIEIVAHLELEGVSDFAGATCTLLGVGANTRIYDVYMEIVADLDQAGDPASAYKTITDTDILYSASDGFDADYTDGSATTATYVHEIHRDIMDRFADVDYDDDYMLGWSTLNADRGNAGGSNEWFARFWLLEPMTLKEVLDQLQFEGGFIFIFVVDADGSGNAGGRWIYVEDTYGSAVHTLTDEDYSGLSIYLSDFSELVTKWIYNFDKHPAENKYQQTDTYTNATARTNWNIDTKENIEEVNFDYLVSCGDNTNDIYDTGSGDGDNLPSESIVIYYDNILADPKVMVSCSVTNHLYGDLMVGDIVKFNDSNVDPFGESWGDLYFMIVETRRSIDGLNITAREVYNAS